MRKGKQMNPGRYYIQSAPGAPYRETTPGEPDVIICRREADFAPGQIPAAAAFTACTACGAVVVVNPGNPRTAGPVPKICMQCAGIVPEPILGRVQEYLPPCEACDHAAVVHFDHAGRPVSCRIEGCGCGGYRHA